MLNKILQDQLKKVEVADLSNYDEASSSYFIPKRVDIKIEEDSCYLIQLKSSAFINTAINTNWNAGSAPNAEYMKIDVAKKMANMIKVVGVAYDNMTKQDMPKFWSGWLSTADIEVLSKV